jgi:hypothetical protein
MYGNRSYRELSETALCKPHSPTNPLDLHWLQVKCENLPNADESLYTGRWPVLAFSS